MLATRAENFAPGRTGNAHYTRRDEVRVTVI